MTEQVTPPNPGAAPDAAATAAATAKAGETPPVDKPADKPAEKQFLFDKKEGDGKPPQTDAEKAAAKVEADKNKTDEQKAAEAKEVKYEDLKLPEGMTLPDEIKAEMAPVIKELGLDTAGTQKLVDVQGKIEAYKVKQWEDMKLGWKNEIMADPDLGGKNAEGTRKECDRVIRQFAGSDPKHLEGLQDMLVLLGAGSNPNFVRFLHNVAKATKEDTASGNGGNGTPAVIPTEKRLWPNMA